MLVEASGDFVCGRADTFGCVAHGDAAGCPGQGFDVETFVDLQKVSLTGEDARRFLMRIADELT